jgi:hypothetical protein
LDFTRLKALVCGILIVRRELWLDSDLCEHHAGRQVGSAPRPIDIDLAALKLADMGDVAWCQNMNCFARNLKEIAQPLASRRLNIAF